MPSKTTLILVAVIVIFVGGFGWAAVDSIDGESPSTPTPVSVSIWAPLTQTQQALVASGVASSATQAIDTPKPDFVDVIYKPASSAYPEMNIFSGESKVCNFVNGDTVVLTANGENLRITSSLSNEDFTVTTQNITSNDNNHDGWIKLPNTGGLSVGFIVNWKADWLDGCPLEAKTPGP